MFNVRMRQKRPTGHSRQSWACGVLCLLGLAGATEELEFSHGISLLHELKYGPDFEHFDYVDPNAPRGGMMTFSSGEDIRNFAGEFDNTITAPPGYGRIYDTLIVRSGDELGGFLRTPCRRDRSDG